ncbi:MAG: hypothetical protein R3202_09485, partial [Candidatus Competibacterales bacterium]|nr:hypothetical protein [Candidatus Competibacterales bacterium]
MTDTHSCTVGVVGDRFMRVDYFRAALERLEGVELDIRTRELDWPDTPMVHGYDPAHAGPGDDPRGLTGLREYLGDPDEIAEFLQGAQVLINHLAPVTGPMLDRLPGLKLIAVARGGPVNIDHAACRARGIPVVNAPGRNASAVAEFTIGANLSETRMIT